VKETDAERRSKKLVPKPRFKGTLPWSLLSDSFDESHLEVYDRIEEADSEFTSKRAELVNLIDGRRSVFEIAESLSAEYGPTDPAHVMTYLLDLEKIGLVSLEPSSAK
jgi:hypothetical protein